jgi:hypothetical protein
VPYLLLSPEQHAALAALEAMRSARLDTEGGDPAVINGHSIPGYVAIADYSENAGPDLIIYAWDDLLRWYEDALAWLKDHPEEFDPYSRSCHWEKECGARKGIVQAMYETETDDIAL